MTYYLDYSAAKMSLAQAQEAYRLGYRGVIRYIDSPANWSTKHTDLVEYNRLLQAGLTVHLVMQTTTTASDGGWGVGVDHGRRALAGANALGYQGPIFFTNDRPTLPSPGAWQDYLLGARSVVGSRYGAYGFMNAMDVAAHMTDCAHFWQAGRQSDVRPYVNFWQDNNARVYPGGIECDRNLVLTPIGDADLNADERNWLQAIYDGLYRGGPSTPAGRPLVDLIGESGIANANKLATLLQGQAALSAALAEVRSTLLNAVQSNTPVTAELINQAFTAALPHLSVTGTFHAE